MEELYAIGVSHFSLWICFRTYSICSWWARHKIENVAFSLLFACNVFSMDEVSIVHCILNCQNTKIDAKYHWIDIAFIEVFNHLPLYLDEQLIRWGQQRTVSNANSCAFGPLLFSLNQVLGSLFRLFFQASSSCCCSVLYASRLIITRRTSFHKIWNK